MVAKLKKLPTFERIDEPPIMQFMPRDGWILEAVHRHEGFLSEGQIARLHFKGVNLRTVRERLGKLYQNGFLARPDKQWRAMLPEMIYWLGVRGAEYIAGLSGELPTPALTRPPPRGLVPHNLLLNDVRIAIGSALLPGMEIERWVSEREFQRRTDTVKYSNGGKVESRQVKPDGYGQIVYNKTRFRFLLELDRGNEDVGRFMREKVYPGVAYVTSDEYGERFGFKQGRWLVVTTSSKHAVNLRNAAAVIGDATKCFYFTTLESALQKNPLTDPIWLWPLSKESGALFGSQAFETKN